MMSFNSEFDPNSNLDQDFLSQMQNRDTNAYGFSVDASNVLNDSRSGNQLLAGASNELTNQNVTILPQGQSNQVGGPRSSSTPADHSTDHMLNSLMRKVTEISKQMSFMNENVESLQTKMVEVEKMHVHFPADQRALEAVHSVSKQRTSSIRSESPDSTKGAYGGVRKKYKGNRSPIDFSKRICEVQKSVIHNVNNLYKSQDRNVPIPPPMQNDSPNISCPPLSGPFLTDRMKRDRERFKNQNKPIPSTLPYFKRPDPDLTFSDDGLSDCAKDGNGEVLEDVRDVARRFLLFEHLRESWNRILLCSTEQEHSAMFRIANKFLNDINLRYSTVERFAVRVEATHVVCDEVTEPTANERKEIERARVATVSPSSARGRDDDVIPADHVKATTEAIDSACRNFDKLFLANPECEDNKSAQDFAEQFQGNWNFYKEHITTAEVRDTLNLSLQPRARCVQTSVPERPRQSSSPLLFNLNTSNNPSSNPNQPQVAAQTVNNPLVIQSSSALQTQSVQPQAVALPPGLLSLNAAISGQGSNVIPSGVAQSQPVPQMFQPLSLSPIRPSSSADLLQRGSNIDFIRNQTKFMGKSKREEAQKWIANMETYAAATGRHPDQLLGGEMKWHLFEDSWVWYYSLQKHLTTWDKFKKYFLHRYAMVGSIGERFRRACERWQNEKDKMCDYIAACSQPFLDCTESISDELMIQAIYTNMRPEYIEVMPFPDSVTSISDLLEKGMQADKIIEARRNAAREESRRLQRRQFMQRPQQNQSRQYGQQQHRPQRSGNNNAPSRPVTPPPAQPILRNNLSPKPQNAPPVGTTRQQWKCNNKNCTVTQTLGSGKYCRRCFRQSDEYKSKRIATAAAAESFETNEVLDNLLDADDLEDDPEEVDWYNQSESHEITDYEDAYDSEDDIPANALFPEFPEIKPDPHAHLAISLWDERYTPKEWTAYQLKAPILTEMEIMDLDVQVDAAKVLSDHRKSLAEIAVGLAFGPVKALLDSGSGRCMMSESCLNRLKEVESVKIGPSTLSFSMANGSKEKSLGTVETTIIIDGRQIECQFHLFKKLNRDLIIGADFFHLHKAAPVPRPNGWKVWWFDSSMPKWTENENPEAAAVFTHARTNLPINLGDELTPEWQEKFLALINGFDTVCTDVPGKCDVDFCRLDTGNSPPCYTKPYRPPPDRTEWLREHINELLRDGIIQKSRSPWASPAFAVPKAEGGYRLVVDYRLLNNRTKKWRLPLGNMDDILDWLHKGKFFTAIDLRKGYYQIAMHPDDIEKTAMNTPFGLFEYLRMPFGLTTAPSAFTAVMNRVFSDMRGDHLNFYLDDIIISSDTAEQHYEHVKEVLTRLREAKLTIKLEKSCFAFQQVKVLGHFLTQSALKPNFDKLEGLVKAPHPQTLKQLRSFLGSANWFARFIPNLHNLVNPLYELTGSKCEKLEWNEKYEKAFQDTKAAMAAPTCLARPDRHRPTKIQVDASDIGMGAVLLQFHGKEEDATHGWRPVAFFSKKFSPAQTRYTTIERECLGVLLAVEKFRPYVEGIDFYVESDHRSLMWLFSLKSPSARLQRWALRLQEFSFKIDHLPGNYNKTADWLSRSPVEEPSKDPDFPEINAITPTVNFPCASHDEVAAAQLLDPNTANLIEKLQNVQAEKADRLEAEEKIYRYFKLDASNCLYIYKPNRDDIEEEHDCWKVYIPSSLVEPVLNYYHAEVVAHYSDVATLDALKHHVFWPTMAKDTRDFCRSCERCQLHKTPPHSKIGNLEALNIPEPMTEISVDLIGPVTETREGYRYILVVVDIGTRWTEAYPLPSHTAVDIAEKLFVEWFCRYGTPHVVVSDNAKEFHSVAWEEFSITAGFRIAHSAPYNPRPQIVERYNKQIKSCLATYIQHDHIFWPEALPQIMCAIRCARHSNMKRSSANLLLGLNPTPPCKFLWTVNGNPFSAKGPSWRYSMEEARLTTEIAWEQARNNLIEAQASHEKYFALGKRKLSLRRGDWVRMISHKKPNPKKGECSKFMPTYEGPFIIMERQGDNTYRLRDIYPPFKERTKVHIRQLIPWNRNWTLSQDEVVDNTDKTGTLSKLTIELSQKHGKRKVPSPPMAHYDQVRYEPVNPDIPSFTSVEPVLKKQKIAATTEQSTEPSVELVTKDLAPKAVAEPSLIKKRPRGRPKKVVINIDSPKREKTSSVQNRPKKDDSKTKKGELGKKKAVQKVKAVGEGNKSSPAPKLKDNKKDPVNKKPRITTVKPADQKENKKSNSPKVVSFAEPESAEENKPKKYLKKSAKPTVVAEEFDPTLFNKFHQLTPAEKKFFNLSTVQTKTASLEKTDKIEKDKKIEVDKIKNLQTNKISRSVIRKENVRELRINPLKKTNPDFVPTLPRKRSKNARIHYPSNFEVTAATCILLSFQPNAQSAIMADGKENPQRQPPVEPMEEEVEESWEDAPKCDPPGTVATSPQSVTVTRTISQSQDGSVTTVARTVAITRTAAEASPPQPSDTYDPDVLYLDDEQLYLGSGHTSPDAPSENTVAMRSTTPEDFDRRLGRYWGVDPEESIEQRWYRLEPYLSLHNWPYNVHPEIIEEIRELWHEQPEHEVCRYYRLNDRYLQDMETRGDFLNSGNRSARRIWALINKHQEEQLITRANPEEKRRMWQLRSLRGWKGSAPASRPIHVSAAAMAPPQVTSGPQTSASGNVCVRTTPQASTTPTVTITTPVTTIPNVPVLVTSQPCNTTTTTSTARRRFFRRPPTRNYSCRQPPQGWSTRPVQVPDTERVDYVPPDDNQALVRRLAFFRDREQRGAASIWDSVCPTVSRSEFNLLPMDSVIIHEGDRRHHSETSLTTATTSHPPVAAVPALRRQPRNYVMGRAPLDARNEDGTFRVQLYPTIWDQDHPDYHHILAEMWRKTHSPPRERRWLQREIRGVVRFAIPRWELPPWHPQYNSPPGASDHDSLKSMYAENRNPENDQYSFLPHDFQILRDEDGTVYARHARTPSYHYWGHINQNMQPILHDVFLYDDPGADHIHSAYEHERILPPDTSMEFLSSDITHELIERLFCPRIIAPDRILPIHSSPKRVRMVSRAVGDDTEIEWSPRQTISQEQPEEPLVVTEENFNRIVSFNPGKDPEEDVPDLQLQGGGILGYEKCYKLAPHVLANLKAALLGQKALPKYCLAEERKELKRKKEEKEAKELEDRQRAYWSNRSRSRGHSTRSDACNKHSPRQLASPVSTYPSSSRSTSRSRPASRSRSPYQHFGAPDPIQKGDKLNEFCKMQKSLIVKVIKKPDPKRTSPDKRPMPLDIRNPEYVSAMPASLRDYLEHDYLPDRFRWNQQDMFAYPREVIPNLIRAQPLRYRPRVVEASLQQRVVQSDPNSVQHHSHYGYLLVPRELQPIFSIMEDFRYNSRDSHIQQIRDLTAALWDVITDSLPPVWNSNAPLQLRRQSENPQLGPFSQEMHGVRVRRVRPAMYFLGRMILDAFATVWRCQHAGPSTADTFALTINVAIALRYLALHLGVSSQSETFNGFPTASGLWWAIDENYDDKVYGI
jgi:hypothetical protein